MKPFGYIDLAPGGKVKSYDPPDALVSNFRLFHREKDDRLIATMEVIPDSHARASIDVLKRSEKPGARRFILKAIKVDSTTVPITRDTTITVEILDTAAMHIPFFQYAKKDAYRDLELRGTALSTILKKTVDLNAIRPPPAEAEVPRETQREFDLVSDHPGVLFTTRRARFGKFYVGPTEDEDHGVALHGALQEPITIDIRSGLNFRKVVLPIGYDMVIPLHKGSIVFDEDTGKPKRLTHSTPEFQPIVPPPDVPADIVASVPGAPGGPPLAEPPPETDEPIPPSPPNVIPGALSVLENLVTPTPTDIVPSPPSPPGEEAPTDTNNLPPAIPTYLPTSPGAPPSPAEPSTPEQPLPRPPADVEVPSEPTLSTLEAPSPLAAIPEVPTTLEAPIPGTVAAETETLPEGVPRYPPNLPFEPVPGAPAVALVPAIPGPPSPSAIPGPPSPSAIPGAPTTVRGPIDETFPETLRSNLTSYIAAVLQRQDNDAPIRTALDTYEPLTRIIQQYQETHPSQNFVLTLPGPTNAINWSALPEPDVDTTVIRIVAGQGTFTFHLRAVEVAGPTPLVSRVIVAHPSSFRMPPNEATRPYVAYLPDGKDAVVVARYAGFRMPPNESSFAYVKILA